MTILTYKGYQGSVVFEDNSIVIRVLHIDDSISTSCNVASEVESAFHDLVDDYIETCEELGRSPQKPYKGSLNVRLSPELHREMAMAASRHGLSINGFIVEAIASHLKGADASKTTPIIVKRSQEALNTASEWALAGYSDFSASLILPVTKRSEVSATLEHTATSGSGIVELFPHWEAKRRASN